MSASRREGPNNDDRGLLNIATSALNDIDDVLAAVEGREMSAFVFSPNKGAQAVYGSGAKRRGDEANGARSTSRTKLALSAGEGVQDKLADAAALALGVGGARRVGGFHDDLYYKSLGLGGGLGVGPGTRPQVPTGEGHGGAAADEPTMRRANHDDPGDLAWAGAALSSL